MDMQALKLWFSIVLLPAIVAASVFAPAFCKQQTAMAEIPDAAVKTPPLVKEQSVSTYVPSEAAPGQGLAVNLIYSSRPRYKEGAPVVVVVPGGNHTHGLDSSTHAAQQGFVELRFAFPGGGKPGFASSGIYDNRGVKSQEALRDIFRFAAGELEDHQGKKISDLLPVSVYNSTVGAVGWSNGANVLLATLSKHASELPFVSFVTFYESPVGALFFPPNLGGAGDRISNKHYRHGTAATGQPLVDWSKLRYDKNLIKHPGYHKKLGEPEIKGVVFFDENGNGVWDETAEFALTYACDVGFDKQIYPPAPTKALVHLPEFQPIKPAPPKLDPAKPDKSDKPVKAPEKAAPVKLPFASYEESLGYFRDRDGSLYIKSVVEAFPNMAFTVFGSHLDHLQRQNDHPHIAMLYNSLLESKPKFLRLNPSPVYVAVISYMKASTFVENRPGSSIESDQIDHYLEPEGLIPDYAYMEAAIAELSDRVYKSKWTKTLLEPLVNYSNGAKPPEHWIAPPAGSEKKAGSESKSGSSDPSSSSNSGKSDQPGKSGEKVGDRGTKKSGAGTGRKGGSRTPGGPGFEWPTAEKDAAKGK